MGKSVDFASASNEERRRAVAEAKPMPLRPTLQAAPAPAGTGPALKALALQLGLAELRAAPPPREYLVRDAGGRGVMPKGRVGMLAAPGGTGKSWVVIGLAAAVARGGRWFGVWPVERNRVLLVLAEEDRDEALRRLHFELRDCSDEELADIASNLVVMPAAGVGVALTNVEEGSSAALPETERAAELRELLRAAVAEGRPFGLVILDPSSRFAGADVETDNAAATRYVQVLETLTAVECGRPTVLLPTHTRKRDAKNDRHGDTDMMRGSSGLRDGVRWVAMLDRRPHVDGVPSLLDFAAGAKSNYTRRADLVLVGDDDRDGALRAATDAEVAAYEGAARKSPNTAVRRETRMAEVKKRVLESLRTRGPSGRNQLADRTKDRANDVSAALTELDDEGLVARVGGKQNGKWHLVDQMPLVPPSDPPGWNSGSGGSPKGGTHTDPPPRFSAPVPPVDPPHPAGCRCGGGGCRLDQRKRGGKS